MNNNIFFKNVKKQVDGSGAYKLSKRNIEGTLLCIVDMNNGFAKEGALYSDRVEIMIEPIANLAKWYLQKGGKVIAYNDYHPEDAKEFKAYPKHCVMGTKESVLVDEVEKLKKIGLKEVRKNSTNGMLAFNPAKESRYKDYIVVGCVTDICVYQFALTLRTYLNEHNMDGEVYVVKDMVDTFDIKDIHEAEFYNYIFLKSMMDNGIKLVSNVEYD